MFRSSFNLICCATIAICCGCGRGDHPALLSVTGLVTYEGKPLPDASVTFMPEAGLTAVGRTDSSGHFSLKTRGESGAMAGSYRVAISATEELRKVTLEEAEHLTDAERKKLSKSLIPERYNNVNASELPATVAVKQPNEFTFNLTK